MLTSTLCEEKNHYLHTPAHTVLSQICCYSSNNIHKRSPQFGTNLFIHRAPQPKSTQTTLCCVWHYQEASKMLTIFRFRMQSPMVGQSCEERMECVVQYLSRLLSKVSLSQADKWALMSPGSDTHFQNWYPTPCQHVPSCKSGGLRFTLLHVQKPRSFII